MRTEPSPKTAKSDKQRQEEAKNSEWLVNTCQFHYELEKLINDSVLTIVDTEHETWLLQEFMNIRDKTRAEFAKYDPSAVFATIMKAQLLAIEIVEHVKADNIRFTILEGV